MTRLLKLSGLIALFSQLATPWVITPSLVSAVVFLAVFFIERWERARDYKAKLFIAEQALRKVEANTEKTTEIDKRLEEHASLLNMITVRLNIR